MPARWTKTHAPTHLCLKYGHTHTYVHTYAPICMHTRHGQPRVPTPLRTCPPPPASLPACLLKQEGAGSGAGVLAWHPGVDPAPVEATGGEGRCFSWFPLSCTWNAFHLPPAMGGSATHSLDLLKKTHRGPKAFPRRVGLLPVPDPRPLRVSPWGG